jgi:uncharacterized damage-inducible protein DinB
LADTGDVGLADGMSDQWIAPEEDPRSYGNPQGELATYREYLTNYRLTLELKCAGLDAEQLATRSVPPSTMSLLGLVRHMAQVENNWFQRVIQGRIDGPRLFEREDDRDWDFNGAVGDPAVVEEAFSSWKAQVALADAWLDACDETTLGQEFTIRDDEKASARDIVVHMIEEYARHCGHADLLRECIDGRTGQ